MKFTGINMGHVKNQNRALVLKYMIQEGAVSRKAIADATGLTASSVTQIVNGFIDSGMVLELGTLEEYAGAGRKRVLVDINYDYAFLWSISLETEHTTIALVNLRGAVLAMETLEAAGQKDPKEYLQKIAAFCKELTQRQTRSVAQRIRAVSVGIPGIVDRERGVSLRAYGIWEEAVPVCAILEQALGLPCSIENNVNAFAMATLVFGEGRAYDNLQIIKWGPGVGSTLIIDGEIYEGRKGKAAEIGHYIVEKDGKKCNCGRRGCLETKVSFYALQEILPFAMDSFGTAYTDSEGTTHEQLDAAIDLFARTIVNSMTIMAPNRVVLFGFMVKSPEIRRQLIEACRYYDEAFNENQILYTMLADKAEYIGPAAAYLHERVLHGSL